jgi:hypothetical protein
MAPKCYIEGSMTTAIWTHLRIFLFHNFTIAIIKCWILLMPVLGAWTVTCTFHYRPWTGLIKPSQQHFHFVVLCVLWRFFISFYFKLYNLISYFCLKSSCNIYHFYFVFNYNLIRLQIDNYATYSGQMLYWVSIRQVFIFQFFRIVWVDLFDILAIWAIWVSKCLDKPDLMYVT